MNNPTRELLGRGKRKKRPSALAREIQDEQEYKNASSSSPATTRARQTMAAKRPGRPSKRRKIASSIEHRIEHATNGMIIPDFSHNRFLIYQWDPPHADLTRLPDISAGRRQEKARRDIREANSYIDDGSDDWYAFDGRLESYEGSMASCIARTFVNRAKAAHQRSWSWIRFEDEELSVRTQAAARSEPDFNKRMELMAESLCEKSRLEVFDQIKERLCNEVFLERYDHNRLAEDRRRQDSMMAFMAPERRQEIAEEEKTVDFFEEDELSSSQKYEITHNGGRRTTEHSLPSIKIRYKSEDVEPYRKNAHFSKFCRNCGEDLELGKCPRCKFVEDDIEPGDD